MLRPTRWTVPSGSTATGIGLPITFSNSRPGPPRATPGRESRRAPDRIHRGVIRRSCPRSSSRARKPRRSRVALFGTPPSRGKDQVLLTVTHLPLRPRVQIPHLPQLGIRAAAGARSSGQPRRWIQPDARGDRRVARHNHIAWALQNGAEAVQAFADLQALEAAAAGCRLRNGCAAGERGGTRVQRGLIWVIPPWLSTPSWWVANGSSEHHQWHASLDGHGVPLLLTACLPNRNAVAQRLLTQGPATVLDRGQRLGRGLPHPGGPLAAGLSPPRHRTGPERAKRLESSQ